MGHLIAIHGGKGTGKNTLAGVLLPLMPPHSTTFAFGTAVKRMCSVAFGVPLDVFYDELLKERPLPGKLTKGMSPRQMMTTMADGMKREYGGYVFANHLHGPWESARRSGRCLLVTDLRHTEEAELVRHLGGRIIHVLSDRTPIYAPSDHVSEQPLAIHKEDFIVENNSTIVTLQEKAALVVAGL